MARNTQANGSFLGANHKEEKQSHIEASENMYLRDDAELEYVKSSNVIRICAFIVARPKFAFGKLIRMSSLLCLLEFQSMCVGLKYNLCAKHFFIYKF